ncbi:hypothetical protein [Asticcacaulis sp. W401b]|uniref:hypothetical protein n=1 Tax=Asticcacaulis sp. W401b TaxID=3388666 RepID=UPI0039704A82
MGIPGSASVKEAVADSCFDVDGITYVKPAPIMGIESQIYVRGRPRNNVKVAGEWPPVGLITPDIPKADFASFQAAFPDEPLLQNWESWQALWAPAKDEASPLQPVVAMKTSYRGWCGWRKKSGVGKTVQSLSAYAMYCFNAEMQKFRSAAVETEVVPPRAGHYVLSVTEVIGMDAANDVSSIGIAYNSPGKPLSFDEFVLDSRIGREQSLALACAYAVKIGARGVLWYEDKTYAWV